MLNYVPGRYRVQITGASLGEAKSGNPQVEIGIEIIGFYDPENDGRLTDFRGPPQVIYLTLTEGTLGTAANPGWVFATLKDLGFVGPSFDDLEPLAGKIREAAYSIEEYEGKERGKWFLNKAPGSSPYKSLDIQGLRKLNTKFAPLLKSLHAAPAKPEPTMQASANKGQPTQRRQRQPEPDEVDMF